MSRVVSFFICSFNLASYSSIMKVVYSLIHATLLAQGVIAFASSTSSLSSLSVTELKRLLSERGVDFRDCLEKGDLVARLDESQSQSLRSNNRPTSSSASSFPSLKPDEDWTIQTFKQVAPSVAFITLTQQQQQQSFLTRGLR